MDQYLGEIRIFAGSYAPAQWELCQGQLLPISENEALYSIIGTAYGGNGSTNFALPDLRGRLPISFGKAASGSSYALGQKGGVEQVQISVAQMPTHTHAPSGTASNASSSNPAGNLLATVVNSNGGTNQDATYVKVGAATVTTFPMPSAAVSSVGNGAGHGNIMPSFPINFIIALVGLYPVKP